jgi:hypothetical protein
VKTIISIKVGKSFFSLGAIFYYRLHLLLSVYNYIIFVIKLAWLNCVTLFKRRDLKILSLIVYIFRIFIIYPHQIIEHVIVKDCLIIYVIFDRQRRFLRAEIRQLSRENDKYYLI